ncbi:tetratricopeptide repeat protein [Peptoniphilus sp. KCTC 25270]|uniref:tetratricopeptide repeat protein n=1 Tax=Peptoniphilus sp. KCTC 25270 TaxID=2897414 RepID=UPI001E5B6CAF|nr:tetratricopeptide repeat protein [Peptoniphilus sp. KCTC 25270]MCD1146621.1 tetratricopeptide repeat protein [Peptoniphilus sp. KCTC 25270]
MNRVNNYRIIYEKFLIDNDIPRAFQALKRALKLAKDKEEQVEILFELGDLYWQEEALDKAEECYEKILKISEEPGAYYALGILNEREEENFYTSLEYYRKAIALDPKYKNAYYYQALVWDRLGDREKAKELFLQCLTIDPWDNVVYSDLSSCYEEEGDYEKALEMVKKSLEINPYYDKALYNLGVIEQRLNHWEKSLEAYYKAIESNPWDPAYYLNASAIYLELGKPEKAIEILTQGIELDLESVNLFYNRACSKVRLGEEKKALEDLKEAVRILPDALLWARRDTDLMEISREV